MSFTLGTASINKTDNGNLSIEPVELFRVFSNVADNVAKQRETTAQLNAEIKSLKATETLLRTILKDTRHQLAEIYARSLVSFVSPPFP